MALRAPMGPSFRGRSSDWLERRPVTPEAAGSSPVAPASPTSEEMQYVSTLASEHCEACEKGTPPLAEDEAATLAAEVPAWDRDGNQKLRREFTFDNFRDAFGFVARAALVAEAEFHHPDIELGWGRAAFELTTHAASGLTRNDFVMAAKLDSLTEGQGVL
jgi:4a-hydroxytetrahydrobiopterin dehydratase